MTVQDERGSDGEGARSRFEAEIEMFGLMRIAR
jgi:hypothetical protein